MEDCLSSFETKELGDLYQFLEMLSLEPIEPGHSLQCFDQLLLIGHNISPGERTINLRVKNQIPDLGILVGIIALIFTNHIENVMCNRSSSPERNVTRI